MNYLWTAHWLFAGFGFTLIGVGLLVVASYFGGAIFLTLGILSKLLATEVLS
jgi:hypothetical protein